VQFDAGDIFRKDARLQRPDLAAFRCFNQSGQQLSTNALSARVLANVNRNFRNSGVDTTR
jgi:hypothetical protein